MSKVIHFFHVFDTQTNVLLLKDNVHVFNELKYTYVLVQTIND